MKLLCMARYEEAVEGSSWAITGQCRWWVGKQWVPASVELVMVGSRRSQVKDATLLLHYSLSTPAVVSPAAGVAEVSISVVGNLVFIYPS